MPERETGGGVIDYLQDPIGAARQGANPTVVGRMRSGWAVMGRTQHLPGYCVLMHDGNADQLTDLPRAHRVTFMHDMVLLGEAVERACRATDPEFLRINYEVLGNLWPHLHGHIHARYRWEPDHLRVARSTSMVPNAKPLNTGSVPGTSRSRQPSRLHCKKSSPRTDGAATSCQLPARRSGRASTGRRCR